MAKTITLIRHAETNANNERRWQGSLDSGLSDLGIEQVRSLETRFAKQRPVRTVASDLARTMQTAAAISSDIEPEPAWREFHVGDWEGLTTDEITVRFPGQLEAFFAGENIAPGGGELMSDFGDRVMGAFEGVVASMAEDDHVHVVTHGGVIWTLLSRLLGHTERRAPLSISFNTAVSVITIPESEPAQLTVFNDATHLDESIVHFGPEGHLVTLFRHGQTEGNLLGRWQGHTDSPLTDLGKQQASAAAAHAPVMGQLYTSPLGRTRATAELLGRPLGLDPRLDDGFKEMSFGTWENLTSAEARVVEPGLYEQIYELGNDLPRGGNGETFTGAGKRMADTVKSVVTSADSDIGVVSHGAVIRAYVVNVMKLDFAKRNTFPVPRNTSMSSVLYSHSHPILTSYNVAPHLEI